MSDRRYHMPAFYTFTALWYLRPTSALWILYLLDVRWTLWQVGVAEAAFHAVALLSDLPTGAFADRYGRRLSLGIGLLIGAAAPIATFVTAPLSVGIGTATVALSALGYTFVGGADRALLYGIAAASPAGSAGYGRLYGRVLQVSYFAETAGAAAGGLLASRLGWAWPYGLTALSQILALLCLAALPPALPGQAKQAGAPPRSPIRLLGEALAVLRARPALLRLVLFGGAFLATAALAHLYAQSTLLLRGASVLLCTLLIAGSNLCAALTSTLGGRLSQRGEARTILRLGALVLGAVTCLIGILPLVGSAAAFLAGKSGDGLLDPVYETRLNSEAPESVRATVLSAPSTLFSLAMILLFPLAGGVMGAGDLVAAYTGMGGLLVLAALAFLGGRSGAGGDAPPDRLAQQAD